MSRRVLCSALAAAFGAGLWSLACAPTVTVATSQPIEIKIDLNHEVRVRLDREVEDLIAQDGKTTAVAARGLSDELPLGDPLEVAAAKRAKTLGERADGYLGAVPPAGEPAQALVERVNAERRARYQELASRYAAPPREVEKLAGARRLEQAGVGEAVMTPDGAWITKEESLQVKVQE
jgi:hypothetical protein